MSEMPVESAMVVPASWQPNPDGSWTPYGPDMRYWDGKEWTEHYFSPTFEQQTGPARVGPGGARYAEWWERGLGWFIDGALLSLVTLIPALFIVLGLLGALISTTNPNDPGDPDAIVGAMILVMLPIALLSTVVTAAYFVVMIAVWGRTLGGMIMGIKAVDVNGQVPGWGKSFGRYGVIFACSFAGVIASFVPFIGGMLSTVSWVLLLVCFLSMLWSPDRQAWQDKAAHTYVVKVR